MRGLALYLVTIMAATALMLVPLVEALQNLQRALHF